MALKGNLIKCEIVGKGALKGILVTVRGMRCINLCNEAIKIFATHFSCNSKIKEECNFIKIFSDVQSGLELRRFRNLTLDDRIVVFKILAISKIIFQALIAPVPTQLKLYRQFRPPPSKLPKWSIKLSVKDMMTEPY